VPEKKLSCSIHWHSSITIFTKQGHFVSINKGKLCGESHSSNIHKHKHKHTCRVNSNQFRQKMRCFGFIVIGLVAVLGGLPFSSNAKLEPCFYKKTCPQVHFIVFKVVEKVSRTDPRMPASLVRLFFHDCFVQVCKFTCLFILPFYLI